MELDKHAFGRKIKELRKRNRLNGMIFGEKVGISKSAVSQIESGTMLPSLDTFYKLIEILEPIALI